VSLFRSLDDSDGGRSKPEAPVGHEELRPSKESRTLGIGTLACSRCDAPVALAGATVSPSDRIACAFCLHTAPVREFLSLAQPTRPARVVVRLVGGRYRGNQVSAGR
jgi:hypothetical protein